jgi:anti-anti-sigma factor
MSQESKFMPTMQLSFPLRRISRLDDLLTVRLLHAGPTTTIEAAGELDMGTSHLMTELAESLIVTHRPLIMILDLAQLRFFCADGIRAVLHVRDTATARGTQLIVRDPSPAVVNVLTMTGMLHEFEIKTSTRHR